MGSYGRVTVGKRGQVVMTEETTHGTMVGMESILPPENKLDKALRLMEAEGFQKRTWKSTELKNATAPFRPSEKFPRAILESTEFDVNKMRSKFLKV